MSSINEYIFIQAQSCYSEKKTRIICFNIDDEDSLDYLYEKIEKISSKKKLEVTLNLDKVTTYANNIIEAFCIYAYRFKEQNRLDNVFVRSKNIEKKEPHIRKITDCSIISSKIIECMRLIDTPPNIMNSNTILDHIKLNKHSNLSIKVLNEKDLFKNKLNGILAINSGSSKPSRLIEILYYKNTKNSEDIKNNPVVLVGKGVIFDSGGLNLKRGDFRDMKSDKTGAIYVYGLLNALAGMEIEGNFIGLLPIVENMPSKDAVHPGDIIESCNGKTIEISNTDAEGRIILADALCYAHKTIPKMKLIIDIATLTGQASSIFGGMGTVILHNNKANSIAGKLQEYGNYHRENYWTLPLHRKFTKLLQSDVADYISYNPNAHADTIMAAVFLNEFVDPKNPWIHLDIAGVAYDHGATGEPIKSLFYFLKDGIVWE
jgi:leucyl aminopeptidase